MQKVKAYSIFLILLFFGFSLAQISELKSPDNQADYIIISSDAFHDSLSTLIEYRASQNLNIKFVSIDQIYSEFQDTLSQQEAIRHFVSYGLEYWSNPKPEYLLIVGDVEIIPSYRVRSRFYDSITYDEDSISVDDHFAINLYEEDFKPDIAIGRFPISTNEQLTNIVDKIILFENQLSRIDYENDFIGLSDYRESELFFEQQTEDIITDVLPNFYSNQRIDRREDSPFYGTKIDIIETINKGTLFLNYNGHGDPVIWADTSFFSIDDLFYLSENERPFIYTAATSSQSFDLADTMSLVEKLLVRENSGTVISFASASLNYSVINHQLIKHFYAEIFSNPELSIGNIVKNIKNDINITSNPDDLTLRYSLLGDPALLLPTDIVTRIQHLNSEIPGNFELYQNYPNPFNPITNIKFYLSSADNVELVVYNQLGQKIKTLLNSKQPAGLTQVKWNGRGFSGNSVASGIYIYRLKVGTAIQSRKMMLIR